MISALSLLKEQLKNARETFSTTVSDIKDEDLHKDPGGLAQSLAGTYAHLIFSEDVIVANMILSKPSLQETTFKDKTGASEPMPKMDENWATAHEKWAKTVKLDMPMFREYEKAVYAQTEEYINSISEEELEKEIDLGTWGKKPLVYLLYAFIIAHTNNLAGEISALKGVHGSKGYPF